MKKVIAVSETEERILTTEKNAIEKNYWITHRLEVEILPKTILSANASTEPTVGNILEGNKSRFYKITKSEKVLICTICKSAANFKIGFRFYCQKDYKHLILTSPIRRQSIPPFRNDPCSCSSGKKFKHCCDAKINYHKPRHYFYSRYMADPKIVKSIANMNHK